MRQMTLSSTGHVAEVVCRVIERRQSGDVWLVPADGTARLFRIDPLNFTEDRAHSDTISLQLP
jgi:hypothetical protein